MIERARAADNAPRALLHARDGPLTQRAGAQAGRLRPRPGAGAARARRDDDRWSAASARPAAASTSTSRTARRSTCRPPRDYPVNLGMACPKGWEALTPLRAPDRATTPLLRNARRQAASRSTGTTALGAFVDALQGDPARRTARESVAFLGTGQMPTEEMALLGALGEVRHGHGARRRQHAPVHGDVGRRLQAGVRLRRAALHLRRLRGVRRASCSSARTCASRTRSCGSASARTRTSPRSSSSIRAGPRPRWRRRSTCALAPEVATCVLLYGLAQPADRARLDRPRLHRRAHQRLRRVRGGTSRRSRSSAVAEATGLPASAIEQLRDDDPRAASACRSGGRWASTRATRACAPRRRSSTSR